MIMDSHKLRQNESGVVALFVVIFSALLMTIVTVSFIQLMIKDQQQATTNDLSQSAYDSAEAGVEDAKRLLLLEQSCANNTEGPSINCSAITAALTPAPGDTETSCDTLPKSGIVGETNNETLVQQSVGDNATALDQAYTCVEVAVNTDDYEGVLSVNQSNIVPLVGVSPFDTIELNWFTRDDIAADTTSLNIGFPTTGPSVNLPPVGTSWQYNYPALMRTQFMQTGTSFQLSDFDTSQPGDKSDANTLFLYPSATGLPDTDFALDARRSPTNTPQQIKCNTSFVQGVYACTATISLPSPIDGNTSDRDAFLRLSALYNGAHYSVRLKEGANYVQFAGVQPIVDSTGRANDLFRRVQSRIQLANNFTYPDAAINIQGDLCKNFTITNSDSGYVNSTTCNP